MQGLRGSLDKCVRNVSSHPHLANTATCPAHSSSLTPHATGPRNIAAAFHPTRGRSQANRRATREANAPASWKSFRLPGIWPRVLAETVLTWQAWEFWGRGWGGRQARGDEGGWGAERCSQGVRPPGGRAWAQVGGGDPAAEWAVDAAWVNNVGPEHTRVFAQKDLK